MPRALQVSVALGLFMLALGLRLYGLGTWPFAGEELTTIAEAHTLFERNDESIDRDSQVYRLPRIIPLGYAFVQAGVTLFGNDEHGSRLVMAFLGAAIVPVIFLLLVNSLGTPTAVATSLLIAIWPEHLYHSQNVRFYIVAFFFATSCMLASAVAVQRRSVGWASIACLLAFAAILSHTITAVTLGILMAGVFLGAVAERRSVAKDVLAVVSAAIVISGVFFVAYLLPLLKGWNSGAAWGYSIPHSVLSAVYMIGWPTVILASLGVLLLAKTRTAQAWYWIICIGALAFSVLVMPCVVVYNPLYAFPLAFGVFVSAGFLIGNVYDCLQRHNAWIGWSWVMAACLLNLPSTASYYIDGSRTDYRTAAQHVRENWNAGDRVAGQSMGTFGHYSPQCKPRVSLSMANALSRLQQYDARDGRLWIVLKSGRSGLPRKLHQWLGTNCSHELQVRKRRFDYADYTVDVYLYAR